MKSLCNAHKNICVCCLFYLKAVSRKRNLKMFLPFSFRVGLAQVRSSY